MTQQQRQTAEYQEMHTRYVEANAGLSMIEGLPWNADVDWTEIEQQARRFWKDIFAWQDFFAHELGM